MGFLEPRILWLLLVLPVLVLAAIWSGRRRMLRMESFAERRTWGVISPDVSTQRRFHKGLLLMAALALSIVAAARPYWGTKERELKRRGIDLLVALDVSRSMLATDMPPSRLETARALVRELVNSFPGHRVGLLPFAGDGFVQCPLTADYGVFLDMLRDADPRTIATQGTDIAIAIETAANAFRRAGQGSRVLLLITDGEDHSGRSVEAAREAAKAGIVVYAVGIGSEQGALLRDERGAVMEDESGVKVVSRLGAQTLRDIARETGGGAYIMEPGRRFDISPLINSLDSLQKGELAASRRIVREERFQWPLGLAVLLLLLEAVIGEKRRATATARGVRELEAAA